MIGYVVLDDWMIQSSRKYSRAWGRSATLYPRISMAIENDFDAVLGNPNV